MEIQSHVRAGLRGLGERWLEGIVPLGLGLFIAVLVGLGAAYGAALFVVTMPSMLGPGLVLAWAAAVALAGVAVGATARSLVVTEAGDSSRERAWGAVPIVLCGVALTSVIAALAATAGGTLGTALTAVAAVPIMWLTLVAVFDVVVNDTPIGLPAAWESVTNDSAKAAGNMIATGVLAVLPLLGAWLLLGKVGAVLVLMPALLVAIHVVEPYFLSEIGGTGIAPRQHRSGDGTDGTESTQESADVVPAIEWTAATADIPWGDTHGTWVGHGLSSMRLYVWVAYAPPAGAVVVHEDGSRVELTPGTDGQRLEAVPGAGPWFIYLPGATEGSHFHWAVAPAVEVAA